MEQSMWGMFSDTVEFRRCIPYVQLTFNCITSRRRRRLLHRADCLDNCTRAESKVPGRLLLLLGIHSRLVAAHVAAKSMDSMGSETQCDRGEVAGNLRHP